MEDPYVTFSADGRWAFVERTPRTTTRQQVLVCLDSVLREGRPFLPRVVRWRVERASVTGLEIWDEDAGQCSGWRSPSCRALWRVSVAAAVELDEYVSEDLWSVLALLWSLHEAGLVPDGEFRHALLLHEAFCDAEDDRQRRQSARARDAPRAQLKSGAGLMLTRLLLEIVTHLDPHLDGGQLGQMKRAVQAAARREEEQQIEQLRSELAQL